MSNNSKPVKRYIMHMNFPPDQPDNQKVNLSIKKPQIKLAIKVAKKHGPVIVKKCNCGKGFL